MAWGASFTRGTAAGKGSATFLTVTVASATITAGEIALFRVAADNITTASGASSDHTVTDSGGHSWTKLGEQTRSSGVAADGVTISTWATQVVTDLVTGVDTVTVTFASAIVAKAATLGATSVGGANTFALIGSNHATGSSTTPSVTTSGLASASYFWLGHLGIEGPTSDTTTADADYGVPEWKTGTSGGTSTDNMRTYSTRRANFTATSDTYNPTLSASADWCVGLYALEEVAGGTTNKNDSDSFALSETQSGTSGGGGGSTSVEWSGSGVWGLGFQNCIGLALDDSIMLGADVAGFHFSEDDGQTVLQSNRGFTNVTDRNIASILPDHTDPDTWYALTNNALQRTTDRGATWTKMSTNAVDEQPSAEVPGLNMGRPRSTGNMLVWGSIAPSGNRWMYAASWNSGVYRSSNNGATFTRIWGTNNSNIYLRGMSRSDENLCVIQGGVDHLYVGAFETGSGTGGLYHIANAGGASTTPAVTPMSTPFVSVEEVAAYVADTDTFRLYVVGFAGSNASRSHGVWHAQNPGDANSGSWVRGPTGQLSTTSPWSAVDAMGGGASGDRVAIGCYQPRLNSGSYEEVFISTDGGQNFTCITLDATKVHHDDVGGPGGPSWPVAAAGNDVGNAGHELAGPSQIKWNSDGTRLYVSRYAGAWKCVTPLSPTGRNWYPMVNSLGVTINGDIAADPNDPAVAVMPNVDRGMFITDDHGATFIPRGTGFNASRAVWWDTNSNLYVFGGSRDSNVDGDAIYFADPVNSATFTSLSNTAGQTLADITGAKRAYGGVGREIGGTVNILAAVTGHGIVRYRWDGVGSPTDGTWATVKGNPPMSNASPSNKYASMDWRFDDICVLYDPSSGLWRGKNGATINGSAVQTAWTLMHASTTGQTGQGFVQQDPANKERVFVSYGGGLIRVDNVFSAADATEVTVTTITRPTAQPPGPICIDSLGRLWLQSRPSTTLTAPGYHRTSQRGSNAPSWTDLSDAYSDRAGLFATQMDVATDGTVYVAMDGFGAMIGTGTSETEVEIADTDTATLSEGETVSTTAFEDVNDNDAFVFTDAEEVDIAGGDAQITDDDDFTLSETEAHDQQVVVGPGPVVPPPLPAVRHVIRSGSGVAYPQVSAWTAEETAPGGYGPATGTMALAELHAAPHLFGVGATWQMWAGSELLWEGILLDPIIDGSDARLVGRGWGQIADREVQRILYLSENYSDWVPGDGDPFNYAAAESWTVSAEGGRLQFVGRKGDDVAEGDKGSLAFMAEGSAVTSIAGTIDANTAADNGNQKLRVGAADFPATIVQAGGDIDPTDGATFDRSFDGAEKDVAQIRIERVGGGDTFANTVKVAIRDLRVRGVATDDEMASSEVVADVFDRLGVQAQFIDSSGDDAMPLDFKGGTLGDVLDHCSLLTGTPWRIVGSGAERVGTFRRGETWATFTADGSTDLLPVQRYNRVTVRFKSVTGRTRQVTATPDDLGADDPYRATGAIFNYALEVDQAHPSSDKMQALAERLLADLIVERYTGSLDRAWLADPSGALRHAYAIAAGDKVRIGDALGEQAVTVTVATKTSSPDGVRLGLAANVPEVDRYEARRAGGG